MVYETRATDSEGTRLGLVERGWLICKETTHWCLELPLRLTAAWSARRALLADITFSEHAWDDLLLRQLSGAGWIAEKEDAGSRLRIRALKISRGSRDGTAAKEAEEELRALFSLVPNPVTSMVCEVIAPDVRSTEAWRPRSVQIQTLPLAKRRRLPRITYFGSHGEAELRSQADFGVGVIAANVIADRSKMRPLDRSTPLYLLALLLGVAAFLLAQLSNWAVLDLTFTGFSATTQPMLSQQMLSLVDLVAVTMVGSLLDFVLKLVSALCWLVFRRTRLGSI